jgi:hypothetical protein
MSKNDCESTETIPALSSSELDAASGGANASTWDGVYHQPAITTLVPGPGKGISVTSPAHDVLVRQP